MNDRMQALLLGCWTVLCLSCGPSADSDGKSARNTTASVVTTDSSPFFVDRAQALGVDFRTRNGQSGSFYFIEFAGSGAALFDYDSDGDLDLYLVQGQRLGPDGPITDGEDAWRDRLYRNDGSGEQRHFTDVTTQSGIVATGYGMGAATGDVDNDGDIDIYVTQYGVNQLWLNQGDGTFVDGTAQAGVGDEGWGTSAAFFDYDHDGDLDLAVTNYVIYSFANHRPCGDDTGRRDYCGPASYSPQADKLYRNRGDGTFEDVTAAAGLLDAYGPGLGVVTADFNRDGWVDLYIANDLAPNQLWVNQQDGTFRDEALFAGAAVNMEGLVEASMGIDAGDVDNDGDADLFMTHLNGETNTLYVNDGTGHFTDNTVAGGLAASSIAYTGFGTAMLDFDNDGWLDIMVANGAVYAIDALARKGDPYPYHQANQLFHNRGNGQFADVSARGGEGITASEISRGLAVGDINNDGLVDVVITNAEGPVRILINQSNQGHHWLGLRIVGGASQRDMLGALVTAVLSDGRRLQRRVRSDASYLSANDPRTLFGLADAEAVELVVVQWPDGSHEQFTGLSIDRYHRLVQGTGERVAD